MTNNNNIVIKVENLSKQYRHYENTKYKIQINLNGAILGMTKPEIKSKFDEIVTFSGVERYIDTPVKRNS